MELKDVILSTLAEMDEEVAQVAVANKEDFEIKETKTLETDLETIVTKEELSPQAIDSEQIFLHSIRERLLVLFEGFQAPNNANIEAKVDMTLNFLEYTLATIDSRLEKLDKGSH
jgi:hypothetical protein